MFLTCILIWAYFSRILFLLLDELCSSLLIKSFDLKTYCIKSSIDGIFFLLYKIEKICSFEKIFIILIKMIFYYKTRKKTTNKFLFNKNAKFHFIFCCICSHDSSVVFVTSLSIWNVFIFHPKIVEKSNIFWRKQTKI
jgi:hypothetical protein